MLEQRQQEIVREFAKISSWEERYKKLIAFGKEHPSIDEKYKTEENRVKGCQSVVWMFAELDPQGQLVIHADSDAFIVKGLVALLVKVYSLSPPAEVLETEPHFIKDIGLSEHLTPTRTNGMLAMIKQIKYYALAYSMKKSSI